MTTRILVGDVRERLRELPDQSVHCCVTSPPYWNLRDYGTARWEGGDSACDHVAFRKPPTLGSSSTLGLPSDGGRRRIGANNNYHEAYTEQYRSTCGKCGATRVDNQLGLEETLDEYVANMVGVFREVRRVLRNDGTCWLNIGSSYASAIIESDDYVLQDDLTDAEQAYVYAELAAHFGEKSEALSLVRSTDAPAEPTLPIVLERGSHSTSELRDEGV